MLFMALLAGGSCITIRMRSSTIMRPTTPSARDMSLKAGMKQGLGPTISQSLQKGSRWLAPKFGNDLDNFDLGQTGDGFWFQGRMVESTDNIAASVNNGFRLFPPRALWGSREYPLRRRSYRDSGCAQLWFRLASSDIPILGFSGNETFASKAGLHVVKANPLQQHDVHSVLEDFTAWSVREGGYS